MRKSAVFATLLMVCAVNAQDNNLQQSYSVDSSTEPPTFNYSWWGTSGMHYLVEVTEDLASWSFLPDINPRGQDARIEVGFIFTAPRQFVRAIQIDPSNIAGLPDTDGDGITDKWELYQFGSLSRDGSGDFDGDGLTDLEEFQFGMNPKVNEVTANALVYGYDATGRLTNVSGNASAFTYTLDAEGNITAAQ